MADVHSPPSMADLWLRNLRMLDLDQLPDWPTKISPQTFKDDDLRLKKTRTRRAEWILFRLFELWDPRETQSSLAELFPALEPTQSIRLRALLLQLLSVLKQDGLLGTCALRKSLLDDCHGPRFEHLLLAFSTAVVKKRLLADGCHVPVSLGLATTIDADDVNVERLSLLSLVHQVSLSRGLQAKQLTRMRTEGLEAYIHIKELTLQAQDDFARSTLRALEDEISSADIDTRGLKKKVRLAAGNDEAWANILISGEPSRDRDPMVEDTMASLWSRTQEGQDFQRHPQIAPGPLSDLEGRLGEQQERLRKWRRFQAQVSQRNEDLIIARTPMDSPRKTPSNSVRRSPHKSARRPAGAKETPSPKKKPMTRGDALQRRGSEDARVEVESASKNLRKAMMGHVDEDPPASPAVSSPLKRSTSLKQNVAARQLNSRADTTPVSVSAWSHGKSLRRRSKSELSRYNSPHDRTEDEEGAHVVDLRTDFGHMHLGQEHQTLAERTRKSMASASHHGAPNGQTGKGGWAGPGRRDEADHSPLAAHLPLAGKSNLNPHASLAERAQQSLQGLEGAPRGRMRRQKSPTKGAGDRPGGESAEKQDGSSTQTGQAEAATKTPTETLFAETVDAESVFKTRARLRRSPPPAG